jgi:hypothetical protein
VVEEVVCGLGNQEAVGKGVVVSHIPHCSRLC